MAIFDVPLIDRVKETSTTTGTGDFTLAGAVTGYRTVNSVQALFNRFYYCIDGGTEWEVGYGYLSGGTTLVRDRPDESTNGGALVNFSAGTKTVFITMSAKSVYELFQQMFSSWRPPISW